MRIEPPPSVAWATGTMPAATAAAAVGAGVAATGQGFDPIDNDEVMAFKRAISDATPEAQLAAQAGQVVTDGAPRLAAGKQQSRTLSGIAALEDFKRGG